MFIEHLMVTGAVCLDYLTPDIVKNTIIWADEYVPKVSNQYKIVACLQFVGNDLFRKLYAKDDTNAIWQVVSDLVGVEERLNIPDHFLERLRNEDQIVVKVYNDK